MAYFSDAKVCFHLAQLQECILPVKTQLRNKECTWQMSEFLDLSAVSIFTPSFIIQEVFQDLALPV